MRATGASYTAAPMAFAVSVLGMKPKVARDAADKASPQRERSPLETPLPFVKPFILVGTLIVVFARLLINIEHVGIVAPSVGIQMALRPSTANR